MNNKKRSKNNPSSSTPSDSNEHLVTLILERYYFKSQAKKN